jgi:MFS family permease
MKHLKYFFTHRDTLAVGSAFILLGFLFGNWATLIPHVKYQYSLSDSELGLILLCMPLGCLIFNFFAAVLAQKWGKRTMTIAGMILLSIAYAIPLSANIIWLVPFGLFLGGICVSLLNISMNMLATDLETYKKVHIMSTCHGMFSMGLMLGSLMRTFTVDSLSEGQHMWTMSSAMIFLTIIVGPTIFKLETGTPRVIQQDDEKLSFSWPTGALLIMIIISLCTNITEGTMADWATLYMNDIVHSPSNYIGWGLSSYSGMMALGRFMGDGWIPKYGPNKILAGGAISAIIGFLLAILAPYTISAIIGFGFVGLGVSLGSPILYASAARYPDIPHGGGLAIMNTFSMSGFLAGPVVIGFISDLTNLAFAFGIVAALCIAWWHLSRNAKLY